MSIERALAIAILVLVALAVLVFLFNLADDEARGMVAASVGAFPGLRAVRLT